MNVTERSHVKVNFEFEDDDRDDDYYRLRLIWGQAF
jgi:hypothetical protein